MADCQVLFCAYGATSECHPGCLCTNSYLCTFFSVPDFSAVRTAYSCQPDEIQIAWRRKPVPPISPDAHEVQQDRTGEGKKPRQIQRQGQDPALTTCRRHHLVQQLHTGALPDFLNYCSQLFVGLLQVTCRVKIIRDRN